MLRMLQLELAYPSEFQFTDNFRFELRLATVGLVLTIPFDPLARR